MGGGAWPFLVGGVICLVNSDNERDLSLLISDANDHILYGEGSNCKLGGNSEIRLENSFSFVRMTAISIKVVR